MKVEMPTDDDLGFQMAPMIDVVFLLIVFFMTVANLTQQERIPIKVPLATKSTIPKDPSGRGVITILENGIVRVGMYEMPLEEITRFAKRRHQENPNFKVFLRADKRVKHKEVRNVMKAVADGGVLDIVFSAYQTDK